MPAGRQCGDRGSARDAVRFSRRRPDALGVGSFVDEEGSTTLAAAVAILVSLALVFGMAGSQWVASRSADVQAVADAGALAGMNVVAAYVTVAQIVDAAVLSLGLVGMLTLAIGLVISALPLVDAAGPAVLRAAASVFDARASMARTAAQGLSKLESAVPYLVAANSYAVVRSNATGDGSYIGLAIPYPLEGESDFGSLSTDSVSDKVQEAQERGENVDELSKQAAQAEARAREALERGWKADCGEEPSMRERAAALAGLSGVLNPNYPTTTGWDFEVPIMRAREYYRLRLAQESPANATPDEATRSAARKAFYRYALEQVLQSSYHENDDGTVTCDLKELPANTDDVREASLYTDKVWPCSYESGRKTLHSYASCPGATGEYAGMASVADEEAGSVAACPVCQFTVTDLGRAPAASTSIENGFEYHWNAVLEAAKEYEALKYEQVERERAAREESQAAAELFREALRNLSAVRVGLAPPGRYGCVCVVADPSTHTAPGALVTEVSAGASVPARAAVSAAVLAPDRESNGNNILANFFDGLVAQGGIVGGASSVLDAVMDVWGDALILYGDGFQALNEMAGKAFKGLSDLGMGNVAQWLRHALEDAIALMAVEPADLSAKKPVLVNSIDVMERSGNDWYEAVRAIVVTLQTVDVTSDPSSILGALGIAVETLTGSQVIEVAEFTIPGTSIVIPLEVDLAWLASLGSAA